MRRVLLCLLLGYGCKDASQIDNKDVRRMSAEADRKMIEEWAHIKLPESVSKLNSYTERGADAGIWVMVEFPCTERAAFLHKAGHTSGLSSSRRSLHNWQMKDQPWWTPEAVDPFESGEYINESGKRYGSNLLISRGETGTCTAFLFVTSL